MLILLVDPDPARAVRIQDELVEQDLDWQLVHAGSTREALEIAAEVMADVLLCTDDNGQGLPLLSRLRELHPAAARLLAVPPDMDQDAMQALDVAHRVLPDPLDALALIDAVEGVMELRLLLEDQTLKQAINRVGALPAAPRHYLALTRLLRDPDASTARIAEVVGQDPTIAAGVLRLGNSAYFSGGREITDLRSAVTRLGQNALRQMVLASEVFAAGADTDAVRDRALRISQLAARLLAGPSADLAATAGLLSEVGLLLPRTPGDDDSFATSYPVTGAYLLGLWGLPAPIVEAVAFHREPGRLRGSFWVAGAVHVAAALVNGRDIDAGYLRGVGLLDRLPEWRTLAAALADAA